MMSRFLTVLLLLTLQSLTGSDAIAGEAELQLQRKQLQALLAEIDTNDQVQARQMTKLQQLQKQLDCQWTYIQDDKQCQTRYGTDMRARLACSQQLREALNQCLVEAATPPESSP